MQSNSVLTPILHGSVYDLSVGSFGNGLNDEVQHGSCVFGDGRWLLSIEWPARGGMSPPLKEEKMDAMQLLAAVLAGGLFVYLLFAMLCPERFS